MSLGDTPIPVSSSLPANSPVPKTVLDNQNQLATRVDAMERATVAELVRQIKFLYDNFSLTYPPST